MFDYRFYLYFNRSFLLFSQNEYAPSSRMRIKNPINCIEKIIIDFVSMKCFENRQTIVPFNTYRWMKSLSHIFEWIEQFGIFVWFSISKYFSILILKKKSQIVQNIDSMKLNIIVWKMQQYSIFPLQFISYLSQHPYIMYCIFRLRFYMWNLITGNIQLTPSYTILCSLRFTFFCSN